MGINTFKIHKWLNMLWGNSVYHVSQTEGQFYSKTEIAGYYNNLTEKVSRFGVSGKNIPKTKFDSGEEGYFSIAIFQYGLGAYDLYLDSKEELMCQRMLACAQWALDNQQTSGGWKAFDYENTEKPYSSMAQGEGVSLLLRAYKETGDEKFLRAASAAVSFMLTPIKEGGTALYEGEDVYFYEYTYEPLILNGWIFSLWGLYDYCKCVDDSHVKDILDATLNTLKKKLPDFDIKYWSKYDVGRRTCSPFYHNLHIAQLNVMYDLFGDEIYKEYATKWKAYTQSFWKPKVAFIKKAVEKIME